MMMVVVVEGHHNILDHNHEMLQDLYQFHILNNHDHVLVHHLMVMLNVNNDNIHLAVHQDMYVKVSELNPYDVIQVVHLVVVQMLHENVSEWQ